MPNRIAVASINCRLDIVAQKPIVLTREAAENFYAEHKGQAFFDGLITFMTRLVLC